MKSEILTLRISELDKAKLKQLADEMQMSMSELVVYLIRKEYEKAEKA